MTDSTSLPPITHGASPRAVPDLLAPDAREVGGLALAAAAVGVAHVTSLGERLAAPWLLRAGERGAQADALLLVATHFAPWLLGLAIVSVLFALRWLPRMQQRVLEPSLIAAWVTVIVSAALAWFSMRQGLWPATWMTTTPETAALLGRVWASDQMLALTAWLALSCLLVPLLSELFVRHALIAWLRSRGLSVGGAVGASALVFGLLWLAAGVQAAPDAALRHGGVAFVGGLALGTVAVRGSRGRGLGLCVVAHGAWMATEAWLLLRALPTG